MRDSIRNSKFEIQNFRVDLRPLVFLCVLCVFAGNAFSQNLEYFAQQIRSGSAEEKRSALFEIRNLQSEAASRSAVPALTDSDEIVRASAAFSVIYLPQEEAFAALAPNLRDKSEIVRRETAYALGKIQNAAAVPLLIQTFQNKKEKSVEVKNACVIALGEIGDAAPIDFLTQILRPRPNEENEFLRRSAARSIGQIAQIIQIRKSRVVTPENFLPGKYKLAALEKYRNLSLDFPSFRAAVSILTQVLQDTREAADTKREAAFALGAIGDASALTILQSATNSKDYYLAEISREALKKLAGVDSSG